MHPYEERSDTNTKRSTGLIHAYISWSIVQKQWIASSDLSATSVDLAGDVERKTKAPSFGQKTPTDTMGATGTTDTEENADTQMKGTCVWLDEFYFMILPDRFGISRFVNGERQMI